MNVALAGASGLIGRSLEPALRAAGHEARRLVRRTARDPAESTWDPAIGAIDAEALAGVDAIVNLAGENIGAGRWTAARRARILRSRVDSTRTLVRAIAKLPRKPRVLVNASAVGIYGDCGDEVLTEAHPSGGGFLCEVCRAWETEADAVSALGVRVVKLRFGIVVARSDGALAKMLPIFRLGLGGPMGTGRQWLSWVAFADVAAAITQACVDERWSGALNVAAPGPVRNAEFARVLGKVLRRPAVMPVPAWLLRMVFGRMADETMLASQSAVPARLQELGFRFRHETVEAALRGVLRSQRASLE